MARLAGWLKRLTERLTGKLTVRQIAAVLIVVGLVVFVVGVINQTCTCTGWPNLGEALNHIIGDFYANVSVDCLSIAFAILVIDRLNEQRAERELKAQLIREMGSTDNGIALRAVRELRVRGWLSDGSLREADLRGASLQGADLHAADLREARLQGADLREANLIRTDLEQVDLSRANLERARLWEANLQKTDLVAANLQEAHLHGADLRGAEVGGTSGILIPFPLLETRTRQTLLRGAMLAKAKLQDVTGLTDQHLIALGNLIGATMPNGQHYDGRFHLPGDLVDAIVNDMDTENPRTMASYYKVPLEDYLAGQEWADENLEDLRREAGLDPDTGLPVEPPNGAEPQPADKPAQPAPRRNGQRHNSSMVAHRVRR